MELHERTTRALFRTDARELLCCLGNKQGKRGCGDVSVCSVSQVGRCSCRYLFLGVVY